jgi:hypothetical protein
MKRRKQTYARIALLVVLLFSLVITWQWAWLSTTPGRLQSLDKYRIYDSSVVLDTSAPEKIKDWTTFKWRAPRSRTELLWADEHSIWYPQKPRTKSKKKVVAKRNSHATFQFSVPVREEDQLDDFVVEFGEWFHHPDSWDELNTAIRRGAAHRSSAFFAQHYGRTKPFLGEIPTSLCYSEGGDGINVRRVNRLQVWKDFNRVDVNLPTPKTPQATIVAARGAYNAQKAIYDGTAPISYRHSPYWVAIYAGSASSSPAEFVVDRITIDKKSADIFLYRSPKFYGTRDIYPYWYLVPLGHLPDGEYTVNVFESSQKELLASTTDLLRKATTNEESLMNKNAEREYAARSQHSKNNKKQEWEKGGELQLRLERLAEFVHAADLSEPTRDLLTQDIAELGTLVFWDKGFHQNRYQGRPLVAPTPGNSPTLRPPLPSMFSGVHGPWKPSNIALKDIWLCDGTDANWFAERTYRIIPEFQNALVADDPTPVQVQIKQIWQAIQSKIADPKHKRLHSFIADGTIEDALGTAHKVLVEGQQPVKKFSADTPLWAVMIAERSFLIRGVDTSYHRDKHSGIERTEFRVNASGYISKADNLTADQRSPVTFGLIPLGKLSAGYSVGVVFSCPSICCRGADSVEPHLLDAKPEELMLSKYHWYLSQSTGFNIEP